MVKKNRRFEFNWRKKKGIFLGGEEKKIGGKRGRWMKRSNCVERKKSFNSPLPTRGPFLRRAAGKRRQSSKKKHGRER